MKNKIMRIIGNISMAVVICLIVFCLWLLFNIDYEILENADVYKILKDNNSIIGAVLAIFGVAWMIKNQNTTTAKIIEDNSFIIKHEAFESKKQKAFDHAIIIRTKFDYLNNLSVASGAKGYRKISDVNYFDDIYGSILFVRFLFNNKSVSGSIYILVLEMYIRWHKVSIESEDQQYINRCKEDLLKYIKKSYDQFQSRGYKDLVNSSAFIVGATSIFDHSEPMEMYMSGILTDDDIWSYAQSYISYNLMRWIFHEIDSLNVNDSPDYTLIY